MEQVANKSHQIQDLVHKMKTGAITKTELFSQLSRLQRGTGSAASTPKPETLDGGASMPLTVDTGQSSTPTTSPQRRADMQDLFEEKRQQHERVARERSRLGQHQQQQQQQQQHQQHQHQQQQQPQHSNRQQHDEAFYRDQKQEEEMDIDMNDESNSGAESNDEYASHRGKSKSPTRRGSVPSNLHIRRQHQAGSQQREGRGRVNNSRRPSSAGPRGRRQSAPNAHRNHQEVQQQRQQQQQPHQQQQQRRVRSSSTQPRGGKNNADVAAASEWSQQRDRKVLQLVKEAEIKRMEECTFSPQIRELPQSYYANAGVSNGNGNGGVQYSKVPLEDRTMYWREQKLQAVSQRAHELALEEMRQCTFKPRINTSNSNNNFNNNGNYNNDTNGQPRPHTANPSDATSPVAAAERLFADGKEQRRAALVERYRHEKEAELRRECTFQPNINRKYSSTPVVSRYRDASAPPPYARGSPRSGRGSPKRKGGRAWEASQVSGEEDLTFRPKVNPIPASMESAQLYVSTNIFERLSRSRDDMDLLGPANAPNAEDNQRTDKDVTSPRVMDIDAFLSSHGSTPAQHNGQQQQQQQRRPSSAPRTRAQSIDGRAGAHNPKGQPPLTATQRRERQERQERFREFLARQKHREEKRKKKLQDTDKSVYVPQKPVLCKKSLDMASMVRQGTFLQRVAKDAIRKEHMSRKLKMDLQAEPECTFKPRITKSARAMPRRTPVELSRGDSLRKETNTRLMKLQAEQSEAHQHTFQPQVNPVPHHIEGRLKILTEPDTYVQRLQIEAKLFSDRQRRAVQEQEVKEFAECTFAPVVHDAPAYVKRIARSVALSKSGRRPFPNPARPDWK